MVFPNFVGNSVNIQAMRICINERDRQYNGQTFYFNGPKPNWTIAEKEAHTIRINDC